MNFPLHVFSKNYNHVYRTALLNKATHCYYEHVRGTMPIAIVSYLLEWDLISVIQTFLVSNVPLDTGRQLNVHKTLKRHLGQVSGKVLLGADT